MNDLVPGARIQAKHRVSEEAGGSSKHTNQVPLHDQNDEIEKYYAILECKKTDSMEEVKAHYRKLIKQYHPDVIQGKRLPHDFVRFANVKFQMIQQAYQFITKMQGKP